MARIRTIKPEFWVSEQVVDCSMTARLLFIGMWNFCDDSGIHPASPRMLKMEVFPGDDINATDVRRLIDELIQCGLLKEYEAEGRQFWLVTGWHHQKVEKPNKKYPFPPNGGQGVRDSSEVDQRPVDDQSTNNQRPVDPVRESSLRESNNTPPTPSEGESVSDDEPKDEIAHHFQTWWQQFPRYRRGAKGPTEKKYRSLCKRRQATPSVLQAGLDRYLQAGYGSSKYAKGALAWLNGELWTIDEFPPAGDATGPPKPAIELTPDEQTVHRAMMHVTMKGRSDEYYKLVELRESGRMAEALEMAQEILPEAQA